MLIVSDCSPFEVRETRRWQGHACGYRPELAGQRQARNAAIISILRKYVEID